MKRLVRVGERELALDWSKDGETCRFRIESHEESAASVREVEPGAWSVLWNGRSYEAKVEDRREGLFVEIAGRRYPVQVIDPRCWTGGSSQGVADGRQSVSAPMPGKVIRVLVAEGDAVAAGQGLVVVEAMKMQNEMKSPRAGRVASVSAAAGATVNAGEVLVTIE